MLDELQQHSLVFVPSLMLSAACACLLFRINGEILASKFLVDHVIEINISHS